MIETMPIDGGALVALRASGKLTRGDYEQTILPRLEGALREHERLRCLCVLGEDFQGITPGAAWEDLKFDVAHRKDFERIAIVTDHGLVRAAARLSSPLFSGELRLFDVADRGRAEAWVQEGVR